MVTLTDKIKELIDLTDLFFFFFLYIDPKKCKYLVGFSNQKELEFIKYLNKLNKPMWIRQVLVHGYTDDKQDLLKLKEFIDSLTSVEKVEILPYHTMGKYKWDDLGLKYELEGVPSATDEDVARAKEILNR